MSNSEDKKILGLNISAAARALKSEQYGGWYRDPWGYPELNPEFIRSLSQSDLGIEIKEKSVKFSAPPTFLPFDMPKGAFTTRPAVTQDIRSNLIFTAAALRLAPEFHSELGDWVYGWRTRNGGFNTNNTSEWELYVSSRKNLEPSPDLYSAQTDITSFFASINHRELISRISDTVGKRTEAALVAEVLMEHDKISTRSGLPQRSTAAAILAQMAFSNIDELIEARLLEGRIKSARRWMDDLSFEGSQPELRRLLIDIQNEGRRFGLEINTSKTKIMTTEEAEEALRNENQETIDLPKVDIPIDSDYHDGSPFVTLYNYAHLDSIQAEILAAPEQYDRTTLGRVLKSLRHYKSFEQAEEWAAAAPLMPHAADKLGRYILDAKRHRKLSLDLSEWCCRTLSSKWPLPPWAAAQYAIAVPSGELNRPLIDILFHWLDRCNNIQQVAVATDRLSRLHPTFFKPRAKMLSDNSPNPQYSRILALGLLNAGESRKNVSRVLSLSDSNEITRLFLEWSKWKPLATQEDFDASLQHT